MTATASIVDTSPHRSPAMRKLVALALLALAGGVAFVGLEKPTPAHAECSACG
jgi:hypothetical protein